MLLSDLLFFFSLVFSFRFLFQASCMVSVLPFSSGDSLVNKCGIASSFGFQFSVFSFGFEFVVSILGCSGSVNLSAVMASVNFHFRSPGEQLSRELLSCDVQVELCRRDFRVSCRFLRVWSCASDS